MPQETYTLTFQLEGDDKVQLDLIEADLKQTLDETAFALRNQARHVVTNLERSTLASGEEQPIKLTPSELREIIEKAKQEERDSFIRILPPPVDHPPFQRAPASSAKSTPARKPGRPRKVNGNI